MNLHCCYKNLISIKWVLHLQGIYGTSQANQGMSISQNIFVINFYEMLMMESFYSNVFIMRNLQKQT